MTYNTDERTHIFFINKTIGQAGEITEILLKVLLNMHFIHQKN